MPVLPIRSQNKKKGRTIVKTYDSFKKGLNTFLLDSELGDDELVKLENLKIIGKGIITQRGGTGQFYNAGGGTVRSMIDYYNGGTLELLAITDNGLLTKKNGTTNVTITGASFASGVRHEMAQILGKVYITDGVHPLTRYDGSQLLTYQQLTVPTNLLATKSSGTSGAFTWSWRVSAESEVGETTASTNVTLANLPENLTVDNFVRLNWTYSTPTSSVNGYVIYGREEGAETYMTRVPSNVTSWIDDGAVEPQLDVFPQDTNTTDGPIAKHVRVDQKGHLILANMSDDPDMFMWSGVGTYVDNFQYSKGGGYFSISSKSGDRQGLTAISEREGKLILFKNKSIYQVTLEYNSTLGIVEAKVQKIIDGIGAISSGTVKEVENSVMFVTEIQGRGLALAKLDYEPNILSASLRFQPISARVQSIINKANMARISENWAIYHDRKYHWFIPTGAVGWTCLVYDIERSAFVGPWNLNNAWSGLVHVDSTNTSRLLIGKSDGNVIEQSDSYTNDEGTKFTWTFQSRKDDFKKPFQLKILVDGKTKLKNVSNGDVVIDYLVEGGNGLTSTAKSQTVSSSGNMLLAGWGSIGWARSGSAWGNNPSTGIAQSSTVVKYQRINKNNVLSSQVQISGTGSKADIHSIELTAKELSRNLIPTSWRG